MKDVDFKAFRRLIDVYKRQVLPRSYPDKQGGQFSAVHRSVNVKLPVYSWQRRRETPQCRLFECREVYDLLETCKILMLAGPRESLDIMTNVSRLRRTLLYILNKKITLNYTRS